MWARLARYAVEEGRLDEAIAGFEEKAAELRGLRGTSGGYVLVDRESGSLLTLTLWDSYETLCASEVSAGSLRRQAMERAQGTVEAVTLLEVAVDFSRSG